MFEENNLVSIPDELIMIKILVVRGVKVMIDSDLAELYGVSTKRLNEQVKRNVKRFPEDFMFQLTMDEKKEVVANCDHLDLRKLHQLEKKDVGQDQQILLIFEYLNQLEQEKQEENQIKDRNRIGFKRENES